MSQDAQCLPRVSCFDVCALIHNILAVEDIEIALRLTNAAVRRPFTLLEAATIWLNSLRNPAYVRHLLAEIVATLGKTPSLAANLPSEFRVCEHWTMPQLLLYLSIHHSSIATPGFSTNMHSGLANCLPEFALQENQADRCLLMIKQYLKCNMSQVSGPPWLSYERLMHVTAPGAQHLPGGSRVEFSRNAKITLVEPRSRISRPPEHGVLASPVTEIKLLKRNTLQAAFDEGSIELDLLKYRRPSLSKPGTVAIISPVNTVVFTPKDPPVIIGASKSAHISLHKVWPSAALQHLVLSFDSDRSSAVLSNIGYEQSVYYIIYKPGFKASAVDLRPGGKLFLNSIRNYEKRPIMVAVYIQSFALLVYAF